MAVPFKSMAVSISKTDLDTLFIQSLSNKIRGEEQWEYINVDLKKVFGSKVNEYNGLMNKSFDYSSKIHLVLNGDMAQSEEIFNHANWENIISGVNFIVDKFNIICNELNQIDHEIINIDTTTQHSSHIDALFQSQNISIIDSVFEELLLETFNTVSV